MEDTTFGVEAPKGPEKANPAESLPTPRLRRKRTIKPIADAMLDRKRAVQIWQQSGYNCQNLKLPLEVLTINDEKGVAVAMVLHGYKIREDGWIVEA